MDPVHPVFLCDCGRPMIPLNRPSPPPIPIQKIPPRCAPLHPHSGIPPRVQPMPAGAVPSLSASCSACPFSTRASREESTPCVLVEARQAPRHSGRLEHRQRPRLRRLEVVGIVPAPPSPSPSPLPLPKDDGAPPRMTTGLACAVPPLGILSGDARGKRVLRPLPVAGWLFFFLSHLSFWSPFSSLICSCISLYPSPL
jgi:hypothetical protein